MARTLWLYNLYRALCTAHLHRPFYVFVFLARGLSLSQILLLHIIFSAAVISLEIPTGAWADRLGRRTSMGLGALLMALASLGYFFAPGFASIAVCEFLFASGLTLTSGADSAYLYDQLKAVGREGEYLRREAAASGAKYIGLGVAAAAGGLLVYFVAPEVTFLVTAAASLGAFGVTLLFPATPAGPSERAGRSPWHQPSKILPSIRQAAEAIRGNRAISWIILYSSLIFVLIRVSDTLFQPVLRTQGFNMMGIGLVFAGLSFVAAATALRLGDLSWRRSRGLLLFGMPLLLAATYSLVSLFGPWLAVALMVPHFMVSGVYSPVVKTLLNEELEDSRVRATVLSAESAVKRGVVLIVTAALAAILAAAGRGATGSSPWSAGLHEALLACGALALLALVVAAVFPRRRWASSAEPPPRGPLRSRSPALRTQATPTYSPAPDPLASLPPR